jgi:Terminase RNaseH-like domain
MLAYYAGTMVKTGTPTTSKNNFYKAIQLNKRRQNSRGIRQNHFQWDWRDVSKYNENYLKFIKKEMLRIGEDSDEFQMSYNCKWLLERGMFVTSSVMDNLCDTSMELVKQWHKTPVVVGIDPARKMDSTVVTVIWVDWDRPDEFGYYDHRVFNWLEIQGDNWEEQYFQIVNFLSNYDVLAVGVDANGVGDAIADRLKLLLPRSEVIPLTSSQSEQSRRWKHLQALIQREALTFPGHAKTKRLKIWKRFYQQMTDAEVQYKGPNFLVAAPEENYAHDDFVDSLAIACSLTQELVMPEVSVTTSPFF